MKRLAAIAVAAIALTSACESSSDRAEKHERARAVYDAPLTADEQELSDDIERETELLALEMIQPMMDRDVCPHLREFSRSERIGMMSFLISEFEVGSGRLSEAGRARLREMILAC